MITILKIIAGAIAIVAAFYIMKAGISNAERVECLKWQEQAVQFQSFYLTEWQEAQCNARGLPVEY